MTAAHEANTEFEGPDARREWVAPRLTELHIGHTQAGPSPNVTETVLTDTSLAS